MEKRYYDAASIERTLRVFERKYGLSSEEFFEAHVADDERVAEMPGWHRQPWASFYRTWLRLSGGGFAAQAARELELA
jgi:hypothetical protein